MVGGSGTLVGMHNNPLPRLDLLPEVRERLLPHCRLRPGKLWHDPEGRHVVGCLDAADPRHIRRLMQGERAVLAVHDPPYNLVAFPTRSVADYIRWCRRWVRRTLEHMAEDASLYVWLGADQNNQFQPLPEFVTMMRGMPGFRSRSWITLRNQRGYGTPNNWMAVRQELLYYVRGKPWFEVVYTEIPRLLQGYYKQVNGQRQGNQQRSHSPTIRPGNVWVDLQQVFYRVEENVSGCYAQKPLSAIERIVASSAPPEEWVVDFFGHSGTTLIACERLGRRCRSIDLDPVYAEIMIRRLEHYRREGRTGWQNGHPFEDVLDGPAENHSNTGRVRRDGAPEDGR